VSQEPTSLYVYGEPLLANLHLKQAVMDGPIDFLGFQYRPVLFDDLPTLENGGAALVQAQVQEGDEYVEADGTIQTWSGAPEARPQLVVTFTLKPDLKWADGAPLTADDSVFSYEVAAHPATQQTKFRTLRTLSYRALDERRVEWVGLPGYLPSNYFTFFYTPLPRHAYGDRRPEEMGADPQVARNPIGWGPYRIVEWVDGDHITLERNPHYFRAAEGLPKIDRIVVHYINYPEGALDAFAVGDCDVGTRDIGWERLAATLLQSPGGDQPVPFFTTTTAFEHLDFNVAPSDDRYQFFADLRVRQAVVYCIDRRAINREALWDQSVAPPTYAPANHPMYPSGGLDEYPFDPALGQQLLAAANWGQRGEDGVLVNNDLRFSVSYLYEPNPLSEAVANIVARQLRENCGIEIIPEPFQRSDFATSYPDGQVFSRKYDLAQFAWIVDYEPACEPYLTAQIADDEHPNGNNNTGWSNSEFDTACTEGLNSLDYGVKTSEHARAMRIFAEQLPSLPLFTWLKVSVARPTLINFKPDSTMASELWNVEEWDVSR
jgi:peptide/nickel transport system substrate-binding protein